MILIDNPIRFFWSTKENNRLLTSLTNRVKSTEELLGVYIDTITFSEDHDNKVNALNHLYGLKSKE